MSRSGLQEDMTLNREGKTKQATPAERKNKRQSPYAPKKRIHTKNENALIFEVHSLENISTTDIVEAMVTKVGEDLIAVKPIFTKNKRSHLEVVFAYEDKQQFYAAEGIMIFKQTLQGYILIKIRQSFLSVQLRNMPMGRRDFISEQIREAFQDIGNISSIKPLAYKGTSVLTDQWVVIFKTTDDSDLASRIPRFRGHIKKEYQEYKAYKASVDAKRIQEQSPLALSIENPYNEEFKNIMLIDSPTADLATPSMKVDKEVKMEDQTASVAETSASSSEEIKVEINPYLSRLTSARKVQ
ncbi:hypothetical protein C2G38_2195797 [Gigaspora rosea]|uniref:Uncharacterized protein n=1 Tax=Gigaspora rosea TaxID=44941 RepID=A0A397UYE8_9GLOM|nr:hypothetical protein C2G38_2195797 [Gigaspora rosea]